MLTVYSLHVCVYIYAQMHRYIYIKIRGFLYSVNKILYSTHLLLIECKTVLKLALSVSAGQVFNFLGVDEKLLLFE